MSPIRSASLPGLHVCVYIVHVEEGPSVRGTGAALPRESGSQSVVHCGRKCPPLQLPTTTPTTAPVLLSRAGHWSPSACTPRHVHGARCGLPHPRHPPNPHVALHTRALLPGWCQLALPCGDLRRLRQPGVACVQRAVPRGLFLSHKLHRAQPGSVWGRTRVLPLGQWGAYGGVPRHVHRGALTLNTVSDPTLPRWLVLCRWTRAVVSRGSFRLRRSTE